MYLIVHFIGLIGENWVLLGNSVMSKNQNINTNSWTIFYRKTQHRDLDIVDGHPSMFLIFAFVTIHVHGNSF